MADEEFLLYTSLHLISLPFIPNFYQHYHYFYTVKVLNFNLVSYNYDSVLHALFTAWFKKLKHDTYVNMIMKILYTTGLISD